MSNVIKCLTLSTSLLLFASTANGQFDTELASYKGKLYTAFVLGGGDAYIVHVKQSDDGVSWKTVKVIDDKVAK